MVGQTAIAVEADVFLLPIPIQSGFCAPLVEMPLFYGDSSSNSMILRLDGFLIVFCSLKMGNISQFLEQMGLDLQMGSYLQNAPAPVKSRPLEGLE